MFTLMSKVLYLIESIDKKIKRKIQFKTLICRYSVFKYPNAFKFSEVVKWAIMLLHINFQVNQKNFKSMSNIA